MAPRTATPRTALLAHVLLLNGAASTPACTSYASDDACVDSNIANDADDAVCFWCHVWNSSSSDDPPSCQATNPNSTSYKIIFRGCDQWRVTGNMHVQDAAPRYNGQHMRRVPTNAAHDVGRRSASVDTHAAYPELPHDTRSPGYGVNYDTVPSRVQSSPYGRLEYSDDLEPALGRHLHT